MPKEKKRVEGRGKSGPKKGKTDPEKKIAKKGKTSSKKGKTSSKKAKSKPNKGKTSAAKKPSKAPTGKKNATPNGEKTTSKKRRPDKGKERAESSSDVDYDVLIVGGGLSGLTTAYYCLKGHPELTIGVFEAASVVRRPAASLQAFQDRVPNLAHQLGGRTYSADIETSPGGERIPVSIGGTWVMLEDWATLALGNEASDVFTRLRLAHCFQQETSTANRSNPICTPSTCTSIVGISRWSFTVISRPQRSTF